MDKLINLKVENMTHYDGAVKGAGYTLPKMDFVDVKSLDEKSKNEFLSRPISDLGIPPLAVHKFNSAGVYLIGELVGLQLKDANEILDGNVDTLRGVRYVLSRFNLDMYSRNNDHYFMSEPKVIPFDVYAVSDDKRAEFFARPLVDLGLTKGQMQKLKDAVNVETIGQLAETEPEDIYYKVGLSAESYTKFLQRLKMFGIDKSMYGGNNWFREMEIEPVDISSLDEQGKQKLLDKSISVLGLSRRMEKSFQAAGISSIGELSSLYVSDIKKIIGNGASTVGVIRDRLKLLGIELKVNKTEYGEPKFELRDTTHMSVVQRKQVLDRPITDFGLSGKIIEQLDMAGIKTIRDLTKLTGMQVRSMVSHGYATILKSYLDKLGLGFYQPEKMSAVNKNAMEEVAFKDLTPEFQKIFLELGVGSLSFKNASIKKLREAKIKTVGDLLSISKGQLREMLQTNNLIIKDIEITLARYGLKLRGSSVFVKDGKIVTNNSEHFLSLVSDRTIDPIFVKNMNAEQKRQFMNAKLEDLGLPLRALDHLEKKVGIDTVGELLSRYETELNHILAYNKQLIAKVKEILDEYGLKLKQKENPSEKTVHDMKVDFEALPDEEKSIILSTGIEHSGLNTKQVQRLNNMGIYTIGDLANSDRADIVEKSNRYFALVVDRTLSKYGLSLDTKGIKIVKTTATGKIAEKVITFNLEQYGLSKKTAGLLKLGLDVDEIEDLTKFSSKQILKALKNSKYLYTSVYETALGHGVELQSPRIVCSQKKSKTDSIVSTSSASSKPQHEVGDMSKRKYAHYKKYLTYIKSRNDSKFITDFEDEQF